MNSAPKPAQSNNGIYSYTPISPPTPFERMLMELEELRRSLSTFTSIMGVTNCGVKFLMPTYKSGKREIVEVTDRCGNKHVCPPCMSYQYSILRKKVTSCVNSWLMTGGTIYTQTLTLPNRNKLLIYKHEDLKKAWGRMTKAKGFAKLRSRFGMRQYLRVLEDSLGAKSSFPHYHLTWFFEAGTSETQMREFCQEVASLWVQSATKDGVRGAQAIRQWSGPLAKSVTGYVRYILKHGYFEQSVDPIALLNAGSKLKPLDFLRCLIASGDFEMLKVWLDYEHATRGLHRIRTSKHFSW